MLSNKSNIAIGTGLVLILFGVMLGSFVNVQGPSSDIANVNTFQLRNSPILMQVGKDGNDIVGYYSVSSLGLKNSHLIQSFSYGVQADSRAGEKVSGQAIFMEIAIIRYSDGASPEFFDSILTKSRISIVSLSGWGTTSGATNVKDWEIILEDVVFTSMAVVGIDNSRSKEGGGNLESITFNYQRITIINTVLDGVGNSENVACWDIPSNRDC